MSKPRQNLLLIWGLLALAWTAYGLSQPTYRFAQDSDAVAFIIIPPAILLLIGWALLWVWETRGEAYWLRLPLHLRRGLLRLYIAVSVPWIAFFGYRFLAALQDRYQHHAFGAFWSLLIVPVGGPILSRVIMWVLDGFRKSEPTASEAVKKCARLSLDLNLILTDRQLTLGMRHRPTIIQEQERRSEGSFLNRTFGTK